MQFLHIDNQLNSFANLGLGMGIHLGDNGVTAKSYSKDYKRPYRFDQFDSGFDYIARVILLQKITIINMFGANTKIARFTFVLGVYLLF